MRQLNNPRMRRLREYRGELLARPALRAYGSSPFGGYLRSALQRIVDSLETPADLEPLPVDFQLLSVREVDPGLFQQITYALRNQQRLWIRYHSPDKGETLDRKIDPHLVFNHDGGWYVAAYCHVRLGMRIFAISAQRILKLRFTEERFERQEGFARAQPLLPVATSNIATLCVPPV